MNDIKPILWGAAIAVFGWITPAWPAIAIVLPILWKEARTRKQVITLFLSYYLVGSHSLQGSAYAFFGEGDYANAMSLFVWIGSSILNATPFAMLWQQNTRPPHSGLRFAAAVALATLPPIGIVGWLNPLLAAGTVQPGLGIWSVLIGASILTIIAATGRRSAPFIVFCLAWSLLPTSTNANKQIPENWVGIVSQWGKPPENASEELVRRNLIRNAVDDEFAKGAAVVFLPENIAGRWSESHQIFYRTYFNHWLEAGKTLAIGATTSKDGYLLNSLVIMSRADTTVFSSRQVVPISMWKPWSGDSYYINWFGPDSIKINDTMVLTSLCYEDFLFPLALIGYLKSSPTIILSTANAWWAGNSGEVEMQKLHIETTAKVLGLPLIRTINLPENHVAR